MIVDLAFGLQGSSLPTDHGYPLYAAVTGALPRLHGETRFALHPVRGRLRPGRELALTHASHLVFRLDHGLIPSVVGLAGRRLSVGGHSLTVGNPMTRPLRPSRLLQSRLVVLKGYTEPDVFLEAARRQLHARVNVTGQLELIARPSRRRRFEDRSAAAEGPVRRTLRIRDREIVGFPLIISGLDDAASLTLQELGLGGRQRFGCGVFVPVRTVR